MEAVTVRVMLGSVSKSSAASSLMVIAQVSASMSKLPSSSPAVIAQLSVVSSMDVVDQTLSPEAASSATEAVAGPSKANTVFVMWTE